MQNSWTHKEMVLINAVKMITSYCHCCSPVSGATISDNTHLMIHGLQSPLSLLLHGFQVLLSCSFEVSKFFLVASQTASR